MELTSARDGDSPVLPSLQDHISEADDVGTVTANGAYDTRRCHMAIIDRRATVASPGPLTSFTGRRTAKELPHLTTIILTSRDR